MPNEIKVNPLNAIFWDYPEYTNKAFVLENMRKSPDKRCWIMKRFLEHARVVDTWQFFKMHEINEKIEELNLSPYAYKKWKRMIQVYGTEGK